MGRAGLWPSPAGSSSGLSAQGALPPLCPSQDLVAHTPFPCLGVQCEPRQGIRAKEMGRRQGLQGSPPGFPSCRAELASAMHTTGAEAAEQRGLEKAPLCLGLNARPPGRRKGSQGQDLSPSRVLTTIGNFPNTAGGERHFPRSCSQNLGWLSRRQRALWQSQQQQKPTLNFPCRCLAPHSRPHALSLCGDTCARYKDLVTCGIHNPGMLSHPHHAQPLELQEAQSSIGQHDRLLCTTGWG